MRKNIIALMLVLPLLFIFVVFSSGNVASVGVSVSASGISIMNAPEGGLRIDLAKYKNDFRIAAEVFPENASNKGYSFRVEAIEGSDVADVSVANDGTVSARGVGTARIVAVSNDGAYTDAMTVMVSSSKPYDMTVSVYEIGANEDLLTKTEGGYEAVLSTGTYRFHTSLFPSSFSEAKVQILSGFAVVKGDTVLLPFEGDTLLSFVAENGAFGAIERRVRLRTVSPATVSGITVNGAASVTLSVEKFARSASFFVQADEKPTIAENENVALSRVFAADGVKGRYVAEVEFKSEYRSEFSLSVLSGGGSAEVTFSFEEFAFDVRSTLPVQGGDAVMLVDSPVTFFAVPSVMAEGVSFIWSIKNVTPQESEILLNVSDSSCTVTSKGTGTFTLVAVPYKNGHALDVLPVETPVTAVHDVTFVQIENRTNVGLAGTYTVAGSSYNGGSVPAPYSYELDVRTYCNTERIFALSDLNFSVSDPSLARLTVAEDRVFVTALGKGTVTVSACWIGNESFGRNASVSLTLNVVSDGVLCNTSREVFAAADAAFPVVLGADVMLGEDIKGDISALRARLGRMKSTYNVEFYKNMGREAEAFVSYVIEFKNDVYGNGFALNAEYFTNAKDAAGTPLIYRGPLHFVSFGEVANVAAQDNISFLVRTDGVTLYNVVLLGCSDSSLEEDGQYKLEKLNNVGTVLELNADCAVLNTRVRNGRTVVRAYGGNKDGMRYFIDSLNENEGAERDRADVRIEGCILSQAREFILKIGANRALRAVKENGAEPILTDASGRPYSVSDTDSRLQDAYFYRSYVMTDVTLKDSVLETSGLFSVGLETNFSGAVLAEDSSQSGVNFEGWAGAGGTSFASVLRVQGDVRTYDWKDVSLIDSSTLIESQLSQFKLNIGGMLEFAMHFAPEKYGDILALYEGKKVVHGGIALYGGGRNYSIVERNGMQTALNDLSEYSVNISILKESQDADMADQGNFLPLAAGTQDFRFYMYGSNSANGYAKQLADASQGTKYEGIVSVSAF